MGAIDKKVWRLHRPTCSESRHNWIGTQYDIYPAFQTCDNCGRRRTVIYEDKGHTYRVRYAEKANLESHDAGARNGSK